MTDQAKRLRGPSRRRGFSLLEVIIATGILAANTVLLLSLFSTGERHADRAETRVLAQMLCQSKLDELIADPSQLRTVDDELIVGYIDWTYSVDWTPSEIDGLVRLRVSVSRVEEFGRLEDIAPASSRNTFELVRWTRYRPSSIDSDLTFGTSSNPFVLPTTP